jgi:hypothetical protein
MDCRVKPGNDEGGPHPKFQFLEEVIVLSSMMVKAGKFPASTRRIASMRRSDSLYTNAYFAILIRPTTR